MIKKILPIVVLVSCNIYAMDKMHEHKSLNNDEYKTITHSSDANNMFVEFTSSLSNMQIVVVDVNGMVCDFCAQAIEKVFMKRDEVLGINVNLENQKVIIYLQKESNIEDETLLAIFEDAGYTVDKINRTL